MNKQTIYDLKPEGKTIYIRVDYNCLLYTSPSPRD